MRPMEFSDLDEIRRLAKGLKSPSDKDLEALRKGIIGYVTADPMVMKWAEDNIRVGHGLPLRGVSDVFGERGVLILALLSEDENWVEHPLALTRRERASAAINILLAAPYLWRKDPYRIAGEIEVPSHVIARDALPFPSMYWTMEVAYDLHNPPWGSTPDGHTYGMDSMFLLAALDPRTRQEHIAVTLFGTRDEPEGQFWSVTAGVPFGSRFPDDIPLGPSGGHRQMVGRVLGMLSFLNSPYIPKETRPASRKERRRLGIEKMPAEEVTFVDLRSALHQPKASSNGEHQPVDWRHQWVVRGHHRAQWYPSQQSHKVIYIAPHIKGPEGLPFKETTYRVVR